ncbi:MAG: hypothetical protein ACREVA_06625 [Burkholderiales bacterium]
MFDQRNLAEIHSPEFPGERLIVGYNPMLAEQRERKRRELLDATEKALQQIVKQVERRTQTPLTAAEIGRKVGQVIQRYKVAKHFEIVIADGRFSYPPRNEAIQREAQMDGIYVIRTSEPEASLSDADTVRSYKNLAAVERVFRTLKGIDLSIRPICLIAPKTVFAHLCSFAFWPTWSSGICAKPWHHYCSTMKTWRPNANSATRLLQQCPRPQHAPRKPRASPKTTPAIHSPTSAIQPKHAYKSLFLRSQK